MKYKKTNGFAAVAASIFASLMFFCAGNAFAQPVPGSYYDFIEATKDMDVGHDKTSLIIYRADNKSTMNDIRCFLKLEDEDGNDVTYTACTATYEWVRIPNVVNQYKKKYYLSGGMAMHLKLKKGVYKISLYTPVDQQANFTYSDPSVEPFQWESNTFTYNTENPTKVIFVYPTYTENGFYSGGWVIDYKEKR